MTAAVPGTPGTHATPAAPEPPVVSPGPPQARPGTPGPPGTPGTPGTGPGTGPGTANRPGAGAPGTGSGAAPTTEATTATGAGRDPAADPGTEPGTEQILHRRLRAAADDLTARVRALDAHRTEVFGTGAVELTRTTTFTTERPAYAQDIVHIAGFLLAGLRPAPGVVPEEIADTFALYRPGPHGPEPAPEDALPGLLDHPRLRRDLADLHRYYRGARLVRLRRTGPYLLAVFRTGARETERRALRWRIAVDGTPEYLDAEGDRDDTVPPAHDVTWTPAGRELHAGGPRPHVLLPGGVRVATTGGRLTIEVAPGDGAVPGGTHTEEVADPRQSLADAAIAYADLDPLLLLRVRPYHEDHDRYFVVHTRTRAVTRLDAIGTSVVRLPRGQGIAFPGGHCLASGDVRTYDIDAGGLRHDVAVTSPAGDAVLHVFRDRADGRTLLLPYSALSEDAGPPITGRGHALLDDGTLVVLRDPPTGEAGTEHTVQLWTSPFSDRAVPTTTDAGPLARVGNTALVQGIADCLSLARTAARPTATTDWYEGLAQAATRVTDTHHWLGDDDLNAPGAAVAALRETAARAVDEIRRVRELQDQARRLLDDAVARATTLRRRIRGETPGTAAAWTGRLTELRRAQGRLEALRGTRYADLARLDAAVAELAGLIATTGAGAAEFLGGDDAFADAYAELDQAAAETAALTTVADADALAARLDEEAERLRVTTDTLAALDLDTAARTRVLTRVGDVLAAVNRTRAGVAGRRRALRHAEELAFFEAEFALLRQSAESGLATAATPDDCDTRLGLLLVRAEDLHARVEDEEHVRRLDTWREETTRLFSTRRQEHLDERAARAARLAASAERVLATVDRRARELATPEDVHAWFAADPLVAKARTTAAALRDLGEPGRADEIDARLAGALHEARRAQRDRAELLDDTGVLRLGRHRFTVVTRTPELTLVVRDGRLGFAVTGTDYHAPAPVHPDIDAHPEFHDQPLVSESPLVYRAEHLAATVLAERAALPPGATPPGPDDEAGLLAAVREAIAARPDEAYDRGVHDHDAAAVLAAVLRLHDRAAPLRFAPRVRAAAQLFWDHGTTDAERLRWGVRARSLARARANFRAPTPAAGDIADELARVIGEFAPMTGDDAAAAGTYLAEQLASGTGTLTVAAGARDLAGHFRADPAAKELDDDLAVLAGDLAARRQLVEAWLGAWAAGRPAEDREHLPEATALLLAAPGTGRDVADAPVTARVTGLLGTHPRLGADGTLTVRLDEFLARTEEFRRVRVPAHRAYTRARAELLDAERARLDLDRHRPRVMPTFARNRLVDQVYLPLIGDNLAKQLGTAGPGRRADQQGLLLLLSPPGYGKTTLIEYVAARLGMLLVKVDGPALGRRTTSLDPAAAPDAAARREIEKVNLALALGSGVILHLDDIQHVSPELLEKFIPLCDTQRRIDGVWRGEARTYDLRGRRFAVTMAGNPYTASGARFRVPDMLANRADVHDLGDVLAGRDDLFALSHIENALAVNPVLAPLAHRPPADLDVLLRMAAQDPGARADQLEHAYGGAELAEIVAVLRHLVRVRDTVLAVNRAYIDSASRPDAGRGTPRFRLQGSYRNTNRVAERLTAVLAGDEVDLLVDDHYRAEARTLTEDAEANLRMLAELRRAPA